MDGAIFGDRLPYQQHWHLGISPQSLWFSLPPQLPAGLGNPALLDTSVCKETDAPLHCSTLQSLQGPRDCAEWGRGVSIVGERTAECLQGSGARWGP